METKSIREEAYLSHQAYTKMASIIIAQVYYIFQLQKQRIEIR